MREKVVVLIDDTADYRNLFAIALRRKNVNVISFESALPALEYLQQASDLPNFIFVDYRMPEMSGDEFVKQIRTNDKFHPVKIILSSAHGNLTVLASEAGADGFLPKPFDLSELYRLVAAV